MRFYRLLLLVFPADFRRRFGEDMAEAFADRWRAARRQGLASGAGLWLQACTDLIGHGLAERRAAEMRHGDSIMRGVLDDLRFGVRRFGRRPGLAAAAILTLALGIGANVAVFSAVRAVLIDDLPYPDPDRLVTLSLRTADSPSGGLTPDIPAFQHVRNHATGLSVVAVGATSNAILTGVSSPEVVRGRAISLDFGELVGLQPVVGRLFGPADYVDGANVVLLARHLWLSHFGGDEGVVGRLIRLNDQPHTVIGVVPDAFDIAQSDEFRAGVFEPLIWTDGDGRIGSPVLARLEPGIDLPTATRQIDRLVPSLPVERSSTNAILGIALSPLRDRDLTGAGPGLLLLQAASALLLLIACANLATLLLSDATSRSREVGLRVALGASRGRLIRQWLTESMAVGLSGAAAGLAVAYWSLPALVASASWTLPHPSDVAIRVPELAFALGLGLVSVALFAVGPALLSTQTASLSWLAGSRPVAAARGTRLARHAFITAEVALCLVILAAAGLLIRSFGHVIALPMGFDPRGLVVAEIPLPRYDYPSTGDRLRFASRLEDELRGQFGFLDVAVGASLPYTPTAMGPAVPLPPSGRYASFRSVPYRVASVDYFRALGIPVIRGRTFRSTDLSESETVIVVNEQFQREYGGEREVMGHHLRLGPRELLVVGVVGDIRSGDITRPPQAAIYFPIDQRTPASVALAVRAPRGDTEEATRSVRQAVRAIDPNLPVMNAEPVAAKVARSQARLRFFLLLLSLFAGIGVLLVSVGIYGVVAHVTRLRTRELGIRLALGAEPRQVNSMVVRQSLRPILLGLTLGAAGIWWTHNLLASNDTFSAQLYGVTPHDPLTTGAALAGFLMIGLVASWLPARRAGIVDPVSVLRTE